MDFLHIIYVTDPIYNIGKYIKFNSLEKEVVFYLLLKTYYL